MPMTTGNHFKSDAEKFLVSLDKIQKKWFVYKICAGLGFLVTLGIQIGNWQQWRIGVDIRLSSLEGKVINSEPETPPVQQCFTFTNMEAILNDNDKEETL